MKAKGIMIQGTASSVGKSILTAGLCRIFTQDGYDVNPFKSQNMSLNSGVTPEGAEIGRAQVMQAEAAKKVPSVKMNPILLKPTSDRKSQIIMNGKPVISMDAVDYFAYKKTLRRQIGEIYQELSEGCDIVVLEGAGSPAEINLKAEDIVNMGMAKMAGSPVILVGDIDKGGVFASLVGTLMLLTEEERKMVKGIIINKFQGSLELLESGLRQLEELTGVPVLGVVPYFHLDLEDEDSVVDWKKYTAGKEGDLEIAVIRLPYMANFTDLNPLVLEKGVRLRIVELGDVLGEPDVMILPGSKSTISDLRRLYESGMAEQILTAHKQGSFVFGICGGYQMLGKKILDPEYVEAELTEIEGLGLLDMVTTFRREKTTVLAEGVEQCFGLPVKGYEIHMGETAVGGDCIPFIRGGDGAVSPDQKVIGTYYHGIFDNGSFTRTYLNHIRNQKGKALYEGPILDFWANKEEQYEKLAAILRESLDIEKIYQILEEGLHD